MRLRILPSQIRRRSRGPDVGRYKLLERVGEGGCGLVYVAEQTDPVRRRVAFKVIKLDTDTKQVVARFETEREALTGSLANSPGSLDPLP